MRLQQLFPRIVAADYEQPKRVSEDCHHGLHALTCQPHAAPLVRFRALRPKRPWGEAASHEQRLMSAQISKSDSV